MTQSSEPQAAPFEHVLAPLDGSSIAETALNAVRLLVDSLGVSVTLVHIIERDAPEAIHGERHLRTTQEAQDYLTELSRHALPAGARIRQHVHTAPVTDVARSIVEHAQELRADLIVLCTHGRGGFRHRIFGSVAQQVIALGETPVLLVPPPRAKGARSLELRRLLVPLDGNETHESGLTAARALARATGASLHLLAVIPTWRDVAGLEAATGLLLPRATTAVLDLAEQRIEAYLHAHLAALETEGLTATAEVRRGAPALMIIRAADARNVDLITLATHGHAGMEAFWLGSVAPRVSARSRCPLLLVSSPRKPPMSNSTTDG
jgi:nucleotide-binding universal stress UspA family protein